MRTSIGSCTCRDSILRVKTHSLHDVELNTRVGLMRVEEELKCTLMKGSSACGRLMLHSQELMRVRKTRTRCKRINALVRGLIRCKTPCSGRESMHVLRGLNARVRESCTCKTHARLKRLTRGELMQNGLYAMWGSCACEAHAV
jgi:hypothetical protein